MADSSRAAMAGALRASLPSRLAALGKDLPGGRLRALQALRRRGDRSGDREVVSQAVEHQGVAAGRQLEIRLRRDRDQLAAVAQRTDLEIVRKIANAPRVFNFVH